MPDARPSFEGWSGRAGAREQERESSPARGLGTCTPMRVAQFIRLCRASHLAEARRLASPWQGLSPAKTCAASRPSRAHGHHLRPSTNCYTFTDSGAEGTRG